MIVDGKEFEVSYQDVAVTALEFDPENPRRFEIATDLEAEGMEPEEARAHSQEPGAIEKATRFDELVEAIVENGGISMPLVVERRAGRNVLIDGDRRLGAVNYILRDKQILGDNPRLKDTLAKLPCMIVKGPLTREERLRLLAHIHVHLTSWRPAAKDFVANQLLQVAGEEKTKTVTRITRGSIDRALTVDEYKKQFSFKGNQAVSWAKELANIRRSLRDEEVVEATVQKAKDGKITSAVHLRELRTILTDPDAREAYLKPDSTIETARRVKDMKELSDAIERPDVPFRDYVAKLLVALKSVKFEELVKYKGDRGVSKMMDELIALLQSFKSYI